MGGVFVTIAIGGRGPFLFEARDFEWCLDEVVDRAL